MSRGWRSTDDAAELPVMTSADGKWWFHYGTPGQREVTDADFEAAGYVIFYTGTDWLAETRRLQKYAYGNVFPMDPDEFADFMMMNHTAAVKEIGEALDEVGWKPWASPRGWFNRDELIGECVDAMHFIANMLVAVGCTDEELWRRYFTKSDINAQRQRDGYTGRNKCPVCHRALDDAHTGFTAPELLCDGTVEGCKMPDLAS